MSDMIDKQGSKKDKHKDTPHALHSLDSYIFDIETIFLVKAVGMLDLGPVAPFGVYCFGTSGGVNRYVGEQDQIVF